MVCYSDDSSESEKKLCVKKTDKLSPVNRRNSDEVSATHGIVVSDKINPKRKSPSKQMRNRNDSYRLENSRVENSSDEEQVDKLNTTNIKVEQFSSGDESEPLFQSPNSSRARKHLFDDDEDNEAAPDDQDRSIIKNDANETGNSLSQDTEKQSVKRRRIIIKKEPISSEDEEPTSRKDPEKLISEGKLSPKKITSEVKIREQEAGGTSSDGEIPPSQFWLHQYKEMDENDDEKNPVKATKKSSLIKSSDSDESVEIKKTPSIKSQIIVGNETSQRKLPARITKTEIISSKYERIDSQNKTDEDESSLQKDGPDNVEKKEKDEFLGLKESGDDNDNDEKILSKKEKPQDQVSERKLSPAKKKQSPKKAKAPPKRKLSPKPETQNNSSTEAKLIENKKNSPKRNSAKELNDKTSKSKLDICDNDMPSEEEEERVEQDETPKKYVLALQKPKTSKKITPKSNSTQMVLVRKTNPKIAQNAESNSPDKSQSSPQKALSPVSRHNDVNNKDLSEDSSNDAAPSQTVEKKASPKKKKHDIDSSSEGEPLVKKAEISQKQQTIKHRKSTGSMPSIALKRKSDSEESSGNKRASLPSSIPKTPSRRKLPDSNSSEPKSNKRAKLAPAAKGPAHTMSDSDETDDLTKLNTTLNKSMAFMENAAETVKSNKSRKSVSINTKQNLTHPPNDAKARKSILKKSDPVATNDSSESTESFQEQNTQQNVQENVQPIVAAPKIVERPLSLRNLEDQESLAHDSTKASFGLDDVSDDDEIYILEVPRTVNPKELKGQTIRLGGKSKLQIGDELYETCDTDATNISCVFRTDSEHNSYKTVNLRPAGCINVRQKLSKNLHVELPHLEKGIVPFPENLKVRHPLFGAEYEDKIVIPEKKVSKKISKPVIKRESITKTDKASKAEKSPKKLENLEKQKSIKVERSLESIKSENNSVKEAVKSVGHDSTDSASSDSDSDASFFQKVKGNNIVKKEKSKKSKNLLGILNLDETPSNTDVPVHLEETVTAVKQKELSVNKKFGLSLNSSMLKMNSFDANTDSSQFFSSTPIKIENDGNHGEGEILANKIRKRKTHETKGSSPKKVKTN